RPTRFDGSAGHPFQSIFQTMDTAVIQTSHCDALAVALQLPAPKAALAAVIRLDGKTAVCPKLALAAEAMGCLQQGHQQGGANWTDRRNLAKQFHCLMLATFPQQFVSC